MSKWPADEWPFPDASNKDLHWTAMEDPEMWALIMCAQATFAEFARCVDLDRFRVTPTYEKALIKAFFPKENGSSQGEHILLRDISSDGNEITATLAASSEHIPALTAGREVTLPVGRLSDWILVRDGKGVGGFTIATEFSQLSSEDQAIKAGQSPYCWFPDREVEQHERLAALPQCTQCGKRNVGDAGTTESVCGICRNEGHRCDCSCGAPLIRFPKAPASCHRCLNRVPV